MTVAFRIYRIKTHGSGAGGAVLSILGGFQAMFWLRLSGSCCFRR